MQLKPKTSTGYYQTIYFDKKTVDIINKKDPENLSAYIQSLVWKDVKEEDENDTDQDKIQD